MELGINTYFIDVKESYDLGLGRVEIVTTSKKKAILDAEKASKYSMKYSIHLPVFLPEWYDFGQWEVYFCDPDPVKRSCSFEMFEENLEFIKDLDSEYVITHFGGVLPALPSEDFDNFSEIVNHSLIKLQALSSKYNIKLLLEYFGLNKNLFLPKDWLSLVSGRENLGLLIDTGHLHLSCLYNNLDSEQALYQLTSEAYAFHLWNTKGNEHYWKYHHVAPHSNQLIDDGWVFSTSKLLKTLCSANPSAPIIIEPNVLFGGKDFIINSIDNMKKLINDYMNLAYLGITNEL